MTFQRSRPLLLVGAALILSAASVITPANAQQAATDCALGAGRDCEETFKASSGRANAATTSEYDAYVKYKEKQQKGLVLALTKAADQGRAGILKRCGTVSPNQQPEICP